MQRASLEFPSLSKVDIDLLDRFVQSRKYTKQKEKTVLREWRQKQAELKQRTVQMIEQQVEDTSAKLKHDFETQQRQRIYDERHAKLDE